MVFSSTVFLFIFLPFTYLLYLIMPSVKAKNILLTAASLIFYAFGEPVTVFLMIFSVAVNYYAAVLISKNNRFCKLYFICAVIFNLLILGIFKYAGFFTETINSALHINIPVPDIRLPVGISFFTFQILSYVADVYKDKSLVQKKFLNVLLYISLFPQLIAGPVIKYYDISQQIENRSLTPEKTASGIKRFICGLSKKILIANTVGNTADTMFSLTGNDVGILTCWLGAAAYVIQIYFDFSGYSDMAIGLGKMFGFDFMENFNYPYTAENMRDFWRRWHISISSWFKEYLYIPLGGNRRGKFRTALNRIIVFFFTGLWHGANMTFIVWGLVHGLFLMLESYHIIPVDKIKSKLLKHLYTMLVVTVTFVIFRAENLSQAWLFIKEMFTGFNIDSQSLSIFTQQLSPLFAAVMAAGTVFSTPVIKKIKIPEYVSYAGTLAMLIFCIISLSSSTFNPFIYLQF